MAISNAELAAQLTGKHKGKSSDLTPEDVSYRFKKNLFLNREGAGIDIGKRGEAKGRSVEHASFNKELAHQYSSFLDNYVQNLLDLSKHSNVLDTPGHEHDKLLLDRLRTGDQADTKKIESFLSESDGWVITTQLMERQFAYKVFALGLIVSVNPEAERQNIINDQLIITRIDEGKVQQFLRDRFGGKDSRPLFNDGMRIDLKQSPELLRYVKSLSLEEKQFISRMSGIDVDDFVVRGGKIEQVRFPKSLNNKKAKDDALSVLYARNNFYYSLGIPLRELDAMPEMMLIKHNDVGGVVGQMEQTGARWEKRAVELFYKQGGIKDTAGRGTADRNFDPNNLNTRGNLLRLDQARRQVITENLKDYLARLDSREPVFDKTIAHLENRVKSLRDDKSESSAYGKKKAELDKKKEKLGAKKTPEDITNSITEYEQKLNELAALRQQYGSEFPEYYISGTIDKALAQIVDKLWGKASDSITKRKAEIKKQIDEAVKKAHQDTHGTVNNSPPQPKNKNNSYDAMFNSSKKALTSELEDQLKQIEEEEIKLQKKKTDLEKLKIEIKNKEDELNRLAGQMLQKRSDIDNDNFKKHYDEITSFGISESDLLNKTLDELMQQINSIHSGTIGWKEEDNAKQENIAKVQYAMAEAKARIKLIPELGEESQKEAYEKIVVRSPHTITLDNLLRWEQQRILAILQAPGYNLNSADSLAILTNARKYANKAFVYHLQALNQVQDSQIDIETKKIDDELNNISFDQEIIPMELAQGALGRKGEIYSASLEEVFKSDSRLLDVKTIDDTTPGYTKAEGEKKMPIGYYELANLLFNYQESDLTYSREKLFKSITQILPPDKLAEWLAEGVLGITLVGTPAEMMTGVLTVIGTRVKDRSLSSATLYKGMKLIMNKIKDYSVAL